MHLEAVVFDWAGTMIDFGSCAPMDAFVQVFKEFGIAITVDQARGPMGLPKWDHIHALLADPAIASAWQARHGSAPTDADTTRIYDVFVPLNARVVTDYADLVPGAAEMVATLRSRGLKIGSTTGYTREIMAKVLPLAANQGYAPDNLVCAGDLPAGRPGPAMMYRTFLDLGTGSPWTVVKVDDTEPGIAEGLAAGCWTVGVSLSGNTVGLSAEEVSALSDDAHTKARRKGDAVLKRCGAHYVIGTVADLLPVLDEIEGRVARGERP
ncbi:MAG: phosphonoacetaldehyde hydrolase [Pseudomonadota bacterium]